MTVLADEDALVSKLCVLKYDVKTAMVTKYIYKNVYDIKNQYYSNTFGF